MSHVAHIRFVGGHGPLTRASSWEVQAAVAQIEGRPVSASPGKGPTTGDLLDGSKLLLR